MSNISHTSFPRVNEELEPTAQVLVDCSLLEAACKQLRKLGSNVDDQVLLNLEALLCASSEPIRVVVELRDGLINRVASTIPLELLTQDDDIEGCDAEDCVWRPSLDGGEEEVYGSRAHSAEVMPLQVNAIFEAASAEGEL